MNNHSFHGRIISKKLMGEGDYQRLVFTVAVRNKMKEKSGEKKPDNMHPCVAFGKLAEMINQYFEVGAGVIVSNAEFTSSSKKNDDGTFINYYNFVVQEIDFPIQNKVSGKAAVNKEPAKKEPKISKPLPDEAINEDDIPF